MNTEYNEWYWKVYRWIKWDLKHFPRNVKQGFKNLYKWLPIIWKDRDWDDHYIFEVLKFKLKNTADYFEEKQRFVGWESEVKYIRICESLIKKIQDDYYRMEYYDYVEHNIQIVPALDKDTYKLKSTVTKNNLDQYLALYPRTKKQVIASGKYKNYTPEDMGIALSMGMERHEKARKLLFKIIQERIEAWWD